MNTRFYVILITLIMLSGKSVKAQEFHYDVNNDGDVNIIDAILVVNYILGKTAEEEKDKAPCEAVDLGLPSGTKWASCNVGATKPEEYGGYYAWGETEEKQIYNWNNYTHCDGSIETCHDLGTDISGTIYDVAHVKWGGNWCMPSVNDFQELLDNCYGEWTTFNGVNGRKYISKINGNSIFLPAAGYRHNDIWDNKEIIGYYHTSTQWQSNYFGAYYFEFGMDFEEFFHNYDVRDDGLNIRPVAKF